MSPWGAGGGGGISRRAGAVRAAGRWAGVATTVEEVAQDGIVQQRGRGGRTARRVSHVSDGVRAERAARSTVLAKEEVGLRRGDDLRLDLDHVRRDAAGAQERRRSAGAEPERKHSPRDGLGEEPDRLHQRHTGEDGLVPRPFHPVLCADDNAADEQQPVRVGLQDADGLADCGPSLTPDHAHAADAAEESYQQHILTMTMTMASGYDDRWQHPGPGPPSSRRKEFYLWEMLFLRSGAARRPPRR